MTHPNLVPHHPRHPLAILPHLIVKIVIVHLIVRMVIHPHPHHHDPNLNAHAVDLDRVIVHLIRSRHLIITPRIHAHIHLAVVIEKMNQIRRKLR